MDKALLGGLSAKEFLAKHWQKEPLLIRQAVPGFSGTVDRDTLFALARDPDVESRLVRHGPEGWSVGHGPQRASDLRRKRDPWTVLVQGVNLWDETTDALMRRFDFIPQTRLDDLMISYAIDGGGVGPHFDDYDVFLLQGMGRRRWQIGRQSDRRVIEDAPHKVLQHFEPEYDWILEPGDMLYLPPEWAHNGIAVGECMTYSIGFRSPTTQELVGEFLGYVQERLCLDGLYRDPDLAMQKNSAQISEPMIDQVLAMIARVQWAREDVAGFLGGYLSEPKPNVFFDAPETPVGLRAFSMRAAKQGLRLDTRSVLLFHGEAFFLNGEAVEVESCDRQTMRHFAHQRQLDAAQWSALAPTTQQALHGWYEDGFAHLQQP